MCNDTARNELALAEQTILRLERELARLVDRCSGAYIRMLRGDDPELIMEILAALTIEARPSDDSP